MIASWKENYKWLCNIHMFDIFTFTKTLNCMPGRKLTLQIILTKTQMLLEMLEIFIWGI